MSQTEFLHSQSGSGLQAGRKGQTALSKNERILIVNAEPQARRVLKTTLIGEGYEVWVVRSASEALESIRSEVFDLVLLDIDVRDLPGTTVCQEIRESVASVIIVVLSARGDEDEKLEAFDAGADDYITKPFNTGEFLARLRAHLRARRTSKSGSSERFETEDLVIDFTDRTITRPGNDRMTLRLSPKQWQLLRYLASNRGKPLSHRSLLQAVWGPDYREETMLLQSLIARLRKKIEADPAQPKHIATVPWFGYRFD